MTLSRATASGWLTYPVGISRGLSAGWVQGPAASGGPTLKTASDAFALSVSDSQSSFLASLLADSINASLSDSAAVVVDAGVSDAIDVGFADDFEDYTTYTEYDPDNELNVLSSSVAAFSVTNTSSARLYKDFTAGHFSGNFKHRFSVEVTSADDNSIVVPWALSNMLGTRNQQFFASQLSLSVRLWFVLPTIWVYTEELGFGTGTSYVMTVNPSGTVKNLYMECERDESVGTYGTLHCRVYSDREYSNLLNTRSIPLKEFTDFRYFYALNTYGSSGAQAAYVAVKHHSLTASSPLRDLQAYSDLSDTQTISINDLAAIVNSLLSTDAGSISISDTVQTLINAVAVADSITASLTDAQNSYLESARNDALNAAMNDVLMIYSELTRADGLGFSIADAAAIAGTLAASDSLSASVTEGLSVVTVSLLLADALDVAVADSAAVVLALLERSDDVLAAIADVSLLNSFSNSADNLNLTVTDAAQIAALINALDSVALGIADAAIRQAFGTIIARLSAKLSIYPSLAGKLKTYVSLSGKTKVNNEE